MISKQQKNAKLQRKFCKTYQNLSKEEKKNIVSMTLINTESYTNLHNLIYIIIFLKEKRQT